MLQSYKSSCCWQSHWKKIRILWEILQCLFLIFIDKNVIHILLFPPKLKILESCKILKSDEKCGKDLIAVGIWQQGELLCKNIWFESFANSHFSWVSAIIRKMLQIKTFFYEFCGSEMSQLWNLQKLQSVNIYAEHCN